MSTATIQVAFDPEAPVDERQAAQYELTAATVPSALADILPRDNVQPGIDYIEAQRAESRLPKASQSIPFPERPLLLHSSVP